MGSVHLPPCGCRSVLKRPGRDEIECVWRFASIFPYALLTWCLRYRGLTSWSRDSENPIKKFPTFFAMWSFITALIRYATGLCPEPDESSPHLKTHLLIPSFHLYLDLPGLFRFRFSVWNLGITSIRCAFLYSQSYSSLFYFWSLSSSGRWHRVALIRTDVSDDRIASIFRVHECEQVTERSCKLLYRQRLVEYL
jgi:hypothetical protein